MQRYPLVLVGGFPQELPDGDRVIHSANVIRAATPPSTPVEGDLWFNTSNNTIRIFDGTTWINILAGNTGATVDVAAAAPTTVNNGLLWYDTTNGQLKVYLSSTSSWYPVETKLWVQSSQPTTGVEEGDIWYNLTTSSFSMYLGGAINAWQPLGSQVSIADILAFG